MPTKSKELNWESEKSNHNVHLQPVDNCYFLAHDWKEKGYETILDLGSGLGRHAIFFAKHGFTVSALDLSEYGVNYLKIWADNENLNIDVKLGDMLSLDYPDNSFDCVFAYHVISHTDSIGIKKIISEIERVLKPGGEVYLSFISKVSNFYLTPDVERIDENTIICNQEPEIGVPHYYADLNDIVNLLQNFNLGSIKHTEYCNFNIETKNFFYYVSATIKKE